MKLPTHLILINVNLEDDHLVIGGRDLLKDGSDQLAGTAPGRKEVDDDELSAGSLQLILEVFLQKL